MKFADETQAGPTSRRMAIYMLLCQMQIERAQQASEHGIAVRSKFQIVNISVEPALSSIQQNSVWEEIGDHFETAVSVPQTCLNHESKT